MNDIELLLEGTLLPVENKRFVATQRWLDKNGEPVEWEICALSEERIKAIRLEAARKAKAKFIMRTKAFAGHMDGDAEVIEESVSQTEQIQLFNELLAVEATVFPDLKNAKLQDKFGVHDEVSLLRAILNGGEFMEYITRTTALNGFLAQSYEEAFDEAKKD